MESLRVGMSQMYLGISEAIHQLVSTKIASDTFFVSFSYSVGLLEMVKCALVPVFASKSLRERDILPIYAQQSYS